MTVFPTESQKQTPKKKFTVGICFYSENVSLRKSVRSFIRFCHSDFQNDFQVESFLHTNEKMIIDCIQENRPVKMLDEFFEHLNLKYGQSLSEILRVNQLVDAFKNWVPQVKETHAKKDDHLGHRNRKIEKPKPKNKITTDGNSKTESVESEKPTKLVQILQPNHRFKKQPTLQPQVNFHHVLSQNDNLSGPVWTRPFGLGNRASNLEPGLDRGWDNYTDRTNYPDRINYSDYHVNAQSNNYAVPAVYPPQSFPSSYFPQDAYYPHPRASHFNSNEINHQFHPSQYQQQFLQGNFCQQNNPYQANMVHSSEYTHSSQFSGNQNKTNQVSRCPTSPLNFPVFDSFSGNHTLVNNDHQNFQSTNIEPFSQDSSFNRNRPNKTPQINPNLVSQKLSHDFPKTDQIPLQETQTEIIPSKKTKIDDLFSKLLD